MGDGVNGLRRECGGCHVAPCRAFGVSVMMEVVIRLGAKHPVVSFIGLCFTPRGGVTS